MENIPIWAQALILVVLLLASAFFSMAETAMMAISRLRLRHLVRSGNRAARRTQALLAETDRLLGVVLLGNNLLNAAATALVTALTIHYVGDRDWMLISATLAIAFLILVFSEVAPKIIGATYAERIALPASWILKPLLWLATPPVWFVNLFAGSLLTLLRVKPRTGAEQPRLSQEELRTLVLEGGNFIAAKHRSILLNLFDLERLTVDDVMTPRARVEALDIGQEIDAILGQLTTTYHNKLPVYEDDITRVAGILHIRKLLPLLAAGELTRELIRSVLVAPYFIPTGTQLLQQLQLFQDNQQRQGLVVDEYGEVLGLVTLEDIVEEIVGEFTTQAPGAGERGLRWSDDGEVVVDGAATLRDLNRRLALALPLTGPRTLNGLLLETLQEIPDGPCCLRFADCVVEVVQIQDQAVRSARLIRTKGAPRKPR